MSLFTNMSLLSVLVLLLNTFLISAMALPQAITETAAGSCSYRLNGVGTFNTHFAVDFTKTNTLPSELSIDTYTVGAGYSPYSRHFCKENIVFNHGDSISLLIPGKQTTSPIRSAELRTSYEDILYGSVRTVAKASLAAGGVHGETMSYREHYTTDD